MGISPFCRFGPSKDGFLQKPAEAAKRRPSARFLAIQQTGDREEVAKNPGLLSAIRRRLPCIPSSESADDRSDTPHRKTARRKIDRTGEALPPIRTDPSRRRPTGK